MRRKKYVIFTILFLLIAQLSVGQRLYNGQERWFVGGDIGINRFFGDVSPRNNFLIANPLTMDFYKDRHFAVSLFFGKEITTFWSVRINFNYTNLVCSNYSLNYKTKISHVHETSLLQTIDIFGFFSHAKALSRWDLNVFIGIGSIGYRSQLYDLESNELINEVPENFMDKNKNFCYNFAWSFGLGFGCEVTPNLKLNYATTYRCVTNDLFDGWQDSRRKLEGYAFLQLGLTYLFNVRHTAMSHAKDNYPLEKKSPNYKYKKRQLKYGYVPINKKKQQYKRYIR